MKSIGPIIGAGTFSEDNLLPISALQHLLFCERQCALIHIEQVWEENRLTAEGRVLHERVHDADSEWRDDVRIARGLRLRSLRLGLIGVADVVEFHGGKPFPVEYKRGKPKTNECDAVQLCAQAMCLEEMLDCSIPGGALFYGTTRRRKDVAFDDALRAVVVNTAARLHALIDSGVTPPPMYEPKCENCSLKEVCLPTVRRSAARYLMECVTNA